MTYHQLQNKLSNTGLCTLLTLSSFTAPATAQSKDRDNPTPLTSNEVTGQVDVDDTREYFYTFIANPGEVTITLDVLPENSFLKVNVDLFEKTSAKQILSFYGSSSGFHSDREIRSVRFTRQQPVVMRVRWPNPHKQGGYRVKLGGAVKLAGHQLPATETNTSVLSVPNQRTLRIEIDDGTTQEFNLTRIRRILIHK